METTVERVAITFKQTKALVRKSAVEVDNSFRQMFPNTYVEACWVAPSGNVFFASAICACGYEDKWSERGGRGIAFGMATAAIARKFRAYAKRNLT